MTSQKVSVSVCVCVQLPWTKKRTIPEIRGKKNAVPRDIMFDDARSAQGKSRGGVADDFALP